MRALGMISGTSHDGIDVAVCDFRMEADTLVGRVELLDAVPYSPAVRAAIVEVLPPAATTVAAVTRLDTLIGREFATAATTAIERHTAHGHGPVDLVCSHGQTVFHWVEGGIAEGTLQLGQPSWIAEATGLPVVSDVRSADLAAGGQGAPLVPLLDTLVLEPFVSQGRTVAALNLGGISNVTVCAPGVDPIAWDIGSANALIDAAVSSDGSTDLSFDRDGALARAGTVVPGLLDVLLGEPYYRSPAPKSTGKELFHAAYVEAAVARHGATVPLADLVATLVELTARTVADALADRDGRGRLHVGRWGAQPGTGRGDRRGLTCDPVRDDRRARRGSRREGGAGVRADRVVHPARAAGQRPELHRGPRPARPRPNHPVPCRWRAAGMPRGRPRAPGPRGRGKSMTPATRPDPALDPGRVQALDLDPAVDALLALGDGRTHPAGAVVGVLAGGVLSVAAGGAAFAGSRDRVARPMTTDTRLDLASVTKLASTTALAMRLVADGTLDLDSPVAKHLPGFGADPRAHGSGAGARGGGSASDAAEVTVRHLLQHTSGLPPWVPLYCSTTDRDEALALAAATPRVSRPGVRWAYSDLGMIVLGGVLESVTGHRQDLLFTQRVSRPLGLHRTAYGPMPVDETAASADSDVIEHQMVATGEPYPTDATVDDFTDWRGAPVVGLPSDGNAAHALGGIAGHAGLFSTVPELLWLGRSLTEGAVVPAQVVEEFTRPLGVAPDRGLGFRLETISLAGQSIPFGFHPGFTGTWLGVALDRDLVIAVAATRLHTTTGGIESPGAGLTELVTTDQIATTALAEVGVALARTDHAAGTS